MASFTVAKAPVAAPKAFKGLSKAAAKPAPKVTNVSKASDMMVWTPNNNKCVLRGCRTCQQPAQPMPVFRRTAVSLKCSRHNHIMLRA